MSISQIRTDDTSSLDQGKCPRCGTELPGEAVFCNACGERLEKTKDFSGVLQNEDDIASRYRMTTLVRRRPFVTLYFAQQSAQALTNGQSSGGQPSGGQSSVGQPSGGQPSGGQPRMVALRDIDLTSLDEAAFAQALAEGQREYDLLRRSAIPHVMPVVDLRYFQRHLFTITALSQPGASAQNQQPGELAAREARLLTLQDFLQSGQGLPSEPRVLRWMDALCRAVHGLHSIHITLGDLDPYVILLSGDTSKLEDASPTLMVSWLPSSLRALLPKTETTSLSYFIAPEAIQGAVDARADVYSLGAILYLLLTGMPPGDSTRRGRGRLRPPQEINSRLSPHVSECVMQALAVNPNERFQSAADLAAALRNARYRRPIHIQRQEQDATPDANAESETVRIIPLSRSDMERWRTARAKVSTPTPAQTSTQPAAHTPIPQRPLTPRPPLLADEVRDVESDWEQSRHSDAPRVPTTPPVQEGDQLVFPVSAATPVAPVTPVALVTPVTPVAPETPGDALSQPETDDEAAPSHPARKMKGGGAQSWKQRVTGMLPALKPASTQLRQPKTANEVIEVASLEPAPAPARSGLPQSWWGRFKQMVLGQQQHVLAAAAIIETPLRVLPDQMYTLRINIMGREQTDPGMQASDEERVLGLSGLVHGDSVQIEVRSVLQQSYAYIVQQATVTIPAEGYVAEVVIPMRPLSSTPTGRRDRLHIFFLDEHRQPLYEQPFAVEVFVSHHVKRGEEGHFVLTIPS